MTADILPLLAAMLACFSVLALFARHNKRRGWVKSHRLTLEDLVALEKNWKARPAPPQSEAPAKTEAPAKADPRHFPQSATDSTNFTQELANFQQSLASTTAVKVQEQERVKV
jgi:hypothetical protein